jgi:toxin CcdB
MAQFEVYENPNRASRKTFPFLLDIQSDLLSELRTTVVIPLCPVAEVGHDAITKLCPVMAVNGKRFVALSHQLAGVDRKMLGKAVADLSRYRSEIIAALDFIVSGI